MSTGTKSFWNLSRAGADSPSDSGGSFATEMTEIAVLAALYFAVARTGQVTAFAVTDATPVWSATGLAFTAVMLRGYRVWPGVALGTFAANTLAFLDRGLTPMASAITASGIAAGNSIEVLLGVYLLRRFVGEGSPFQRLSHMLKFLGFIGLMATGVGAGIGVSCVCLADIVPTSRWLHLWWTWWSGNTLRVLVVTPTLLVWLHEGWPRWNRREWAEAVVVLGLLTATCYLMFRAPEGLPAGLTYRLEYLTFPLIGWATLRYGLRGATLSTLLVASLSGWYTVRGIGPFFVDSPRDSLIVVQVYQAMIAVTALAFASVLFERGEAADTAQRSEERLRAVLDNSPDIIMTCDVDGGITYLNRALRPKTIEDLIGANSHGLLPVEYRDQSRQAFARALGGEDIDTYEVQLPDGRWFSNRIVPIRHGGRVTSVLNIATEVTQRRRAVDALHRRDAVLEAVSFAAEQYLRTTSWREQIAAVLDRLGLASGAKRVYILENVVSPDGERGAELRHQWLAPGTEPDAGATLHEDATAYVWQCPRWLAMLERGDVVCGCVDGFPPDERHLLMPLGIASMVIVPVFAGTDWWGVMGFEDRGEGHDWPAVEIDALRAAAGTLGAAIQRERAQAERIRLATAIEQAGEAVVITAPDGTIQYVNPAFERITGFSREEAIGLAPEIFKSGKHDAAFYESVRAKLRQGEVWQGHIINKRKDGTLIEEEMSISPVRNQAGEIVNHVAVARDVTNEVEMERQLRQAQKMQAVGTLAGGIAHDFNNILAIIFAYADLAREDLAPGSFAYENFEKILSAGMRARDLVRQILTFSSQSETQREPVLVHAVVGDTLKLLRASVPSSVKIAEEIDPHCGLVLANVTQIHQLVMNLCTNALHAMQEGGGTLDVRLGRVRVNGPFESQTPQIKEGNYLRLTVADTGCGMDEITRERIFEPFFTTKELGKGTGLGLAIVHGIVTNHDGAISVASELKKGTTFNVFLPLLEGEPV